MAKTAIIKFDKDKHGGRVRGAVNGQKFDFPVDKDVTVTEGQLNALRDSGATFEIVSPLAGEDADEGSSASSTVTGTAIRLGEEDGTINQSDPAEPVPVLSQRTDKELASASQEAGAAAAPADEGNAQGGSTSPTPTPASAGTTTETPAAAKPARRRAAAAKK